MNRINLDKYDAAIKQLNQAVRNSKPTESTVREAFLSDKVKKLLECYLENDLLPNELLSSNASKVEFLEELARNYRRKMQIELSSGKILGETAHKPWVEDALKKGILKFQRFNDIYKEKILKNKMSEASIEAIDKISTEVLDYMGNPRSEFGYKTKGLLFGDVQSGKTAAFTGICHKAIDAGYRLIIVLTGTKSTLRAQTQDRLQHDLFGVVDDGEVRKKDEFDSNIAYSLLTTYNKDFDQSKKDQIIRPDDEKQVALAVVQKNSKILGNIIEWIKKNEGVGVNKIPTLIIDDEADTASINTNKPEDNPTAINDKIKTILGKFQKVAYLAVTATPFANIFIDPQLDENGNPRQDVLSDLFPTNYIYPIPTPVAYVGVQKLFGQSGEVFDAEKEVTDPKAKFSFKYNCIVPVSDSDKEGSVEKMVYSGKLKPDTDLTHLPESMIDAILYFCCVCACKDIENKFVPSNTSMLIHLARYKGVHKKLADLVQDVIDNVISLVSTQSHRRISSANPLANNKLYLRMQKIWDTGLREELFWENQTWGGDKPKTLREISGYSFSEVWGTRLEESVKLITVVTINSESKANTNSLYKNKDAKVIAVGGDAISRGLTLEGLCVTYFTRSSCAYDTLLQMGRWFGYKYSEADYMKIWMSRKLIEAFELISDALTEFKETIKDMVDQKRTPSDFGLQIRVAPRIAEMILRVTAANKMRMSKRVHIKKRITGTYFHGSTYPLEEDKRTKNNEVVKKFLQSLDSPKRGEDAYPGCIGSNHLVWKNVPAQMIANLLKDWKIPDWSENLKIEPVAERIGERNDIWDVRLISSSKNDEYAFDPFGLGVQINPSFRTMVKKKAWIQVKGRNVYSKRDIYSHWTPEKYKQIQEEFGNQSSSHRKDLNADTQLRIPGEHAQLLIYTVKPKKADSEKEGEVTLQDNFIAAIVFGIPSDYTEKAMVDFEYAVNEVALRMQNEGSEDYDDDNR